MIEFLNRTISLLFLVFRELNKLIVITELKDKIRLQTGLAS